MEKIPTVREFCQRWGEDIDIEHAMIEFAKLHVEAALEAASEKGRCSNGTSVVIKDSILNSYPLENIK
jgi:hypothetical protein